VPVLEVRWSPRPDLPGFVIDLADHRRMVLPLAAFDPNPDGRSRLGSSLRHFAPGRRGGKRVASRLLAALVEAAQAAVSRAGDSGGEKPNEIKGFSADDDEDAWSEEEWLDRVEREVFLGVLDDDPEALGLPRLSPAGDGQQVVSMRWNDPPRTVEPGRAPDGYATIAPPPDDDVPPDAA